MKATNQRGFAAAAIAVALAVGSLQGCKTLPPPTREEIQAQSVLKNVSLDRNWAEVGDVTGTIGDNWLASFNDPQLNLLVAEAIRNNPDLSAAAARLEQAAGYVDRAKAALRPMIGIGGTGGIKAGGGTDVSSALQGIMLAISWEPDLWGRLRYARNAAQETYASAECDLEFARQSLAASTAQSWFLATETLLQQKLAQGMVRSAHDLVAVAEKRVRIGVDAEQDAAIARANLGDFQDAEKEASLAHRNALRALELLLGRYPAAELQAQSELTKLPGEVPAGMPLQMLERRPDIIAAEHQVAAAFNRVGEAKMASLPRLKLGASTALIDSELVELSKDFQNPTFGAGVDGVAPIYSGGMFTADVVIRTAEQKEAVANYGRMALRAIGDVENALAASHSLSEREPLLRQIVADNQKALDLSQTSYRVGQIDLRDVRMQQLSVFAAQSELLRVESDQLQQRTILHLALGGSFEAPQTVPVEEGADAEAAE